MSEIVPQAIDDLCRSAASCNVCFESGLPIVRTRVDLAQPRWIGPGYWTSRPRVLIVLTNPGAGNARAATADLTFRQLLTDYRDGKTDLGPTFKHQRKDMANWGDLICYYIDGFGLDLDETAFVNIAWCASISRKTPPANAYPSAMLKRCFSEFTQPLAKELNPQLLILGGDKAASFAPQLKSILPDSEAVSVLHYAHRPLDLPKRPHQIEHVREILARLRS